MTLFLTAQILAPIRAPLSVLPYLIKLFIFFVLRTSYKILNNNYKRVAIHHAGDVVNVVLTAAVIMLFVGPPRMQPLVFLLYIPVLAELIRLATEHAQQAFSFAWQQIPHRRIAQTIISRQQSHPLWKWLAMSFSRYCHYYSMSDEERVQHVLHVLKHRAMLDTDLLKRLEYLHAFRLFPQDHPLRGGLVRDVAGGQVFANRLWTSDPWLLVGLALRRTPWMFDPRYLQRPFYYRTTSARLATELVLRHARYCPPFIVYQFGHEIKDARYDLFYTVLHWIGVHIEEPVREDGTYGFDQLLCWLEKRLGCGSADLNQRPLWTDEEAIVDIVRRLGAGESMSPLDIAIRYTYPLKYVEEALWDKVLAAKVHPSEQSSKSA